MPAVEAVFVCDCKTAMGDVLTIVGSVPELGSWTASAGLTMETSAADYPTWTSPPVKIELPEGQDTVEYKYVRSGNQGAHWEPGKNRTLMLSECAGEDVESTTIQDGHFNLSERSRANSDRIKKLRSMSSFDTMSICSQRSTLADTELLEEERQSTAAEKEISAQKDQQIEKLMAEVENLKVARVQSERLRAELDSERTDRARSRNRKREKSRDRSRELQQRDAKAAEMAAELQKFKQQEAEAKQAKEEAAKLAAELEAAKAAKAEAEKLKAELQKERRDRAASRTRHQTRTKELARLVEEKAIEEEPAQPELWAQQKSWEALTELPADMKDMKPVQDASGHLAKASSFYAQAAEAVRQASSLEAQAAETLRQAQRQESQGISELSTNDASSERSVTGSSEETYKGAPEDLEAARQAIELRKQRRSAEKAKEECERQQREVTSEARRLRLQLKQQKRRPLRPLLGGMILAIVAASGFSAASGWPQWTTLQDQADRVFGPDGSVRRLYYSITGEEKPRRRFLGA